MNLYELKCRINPFLSLFSRFIFACWEFSVLFGCISHTLKWCLAPDCSWKNMRILQNKFRIGSVSEQVISFGQLSCLSADPKLVINYWQLTSNELVMRRITDSLPYQVFHSCNNEALSNFFLFWRFFPPPPKFSIWY